MFFFSNKHPILVKNNISIGNNVLKKKTNNLFIKKMLLLNEVTIRAFLDQTITTNVFLDQTLCPA